MNKNLSKKLNKLDHTIPIYSPRTTYKNIRQNDENLLADLTLNFDPFTINVLKNEFLIRNQEITLPEFILVVKEHLLSWQVDIPNREEKLIRCLANLFEEIDLNGNKLLEWDEFTNYIIEKATVLNNIKSKSDEIKQYSKSIVKPLDSNKMHKKFNFPITKIIYLPNIDRLAMFEEGTSEVLFMNPETGIINQKNLKVKPKPLCVKMSTVKKEEGQIKIEKKDTVIDQKTSLLDILYIPDKKYQVLITSSNDAFVRGWRQSSNGWVLAAQPENDEEVIEHHFNNEIYNLAWDSQNEKLYCGQKDGSISIWNFKTDTEDQFKSGVDGGHKRVIMDMIAMPKLQFLASASLDGKVILWETINNTKKRVYQEHTRGIVSLAFNESLILLFSAGFDHEVCVWNPYIDNLIYKITTHSAPLLCVKVIEGTSQIISLDSEGNVKVTDIKKFNQVQQFSVESSDEKHKFVPQNMTYIQKPLKLAFSGRSVQLFEYDKNYNPKYVDDYVAICCRFIPSQLCFYTPAGNKVKLWSALTGDIKKIFSDLTQGEITVFNMDRHEKRMIIGDSLGQTRLFNVVNGAKIKSLPKHQGPVTHVLHGMQRKGEEEPEEFFLTAGMDNKIHMTRDNEFDENELIRTLELKDVLITALSFHSKGKAIIVGTNNGITGFYESDTGKLNGSFSETLNYEEISGITLIPDNKLFILTTTSIGNINVIAMPPLLYKYTKVYTFPNNDPTISGQQLAVTEGVYCQNKQLFYVADDKGYIRCYDISLIIKELFNVQKIQDSLHSKSYSTLPQFPPDAVQQIWIIRGHNEVIKSLQYVPEENLLQTTAFDKKVKLWNSENGQPIDGFMQNYDKKDPKPIAFKRSGTEEIYDTNLEDRIDKKAVEEKRRQERIAKQQQNSNNFLKMDISNRASLANTGNMQQQQEQEPQQTTDTNQDVFAVFSQQKSPDEQFNPYYYQDKIDQKSIENQLSNPDWKLHINFKKYYEKFDQEIKELTKEVRELEKNEDKEVQDKMYRVFKAAQNQSHLVDRAQNQIKNHKKQLEEKQQQEQKNKSKLQASSPNQQNMQQSQQTVKPSSKPSTPGLNNSISSSSSKQFQGVQKKTQQSQHWNQLYRKELKGKQLYRSNYQISLSKSEAEAAYKLAGALTNYDPEDYKALKFMELKIKDTPEPKKKQTSRSNTKSMNY